MNGTEKDKIKQFLVNHTGGLFFIVYHLSFKNTYQPIEMIHNLCNDHQTKPTDTQRIVWTRCHKINSIMSVPPEAG